VEHVLQQTASAQLHKDRYKISFLIEENIPDIGEPSRYRRTFLIQENIPVTGEPSRYKRTF